MFGQPTTSPEEPQMKWAAQMANTGEGSFEPGQWGDQTKQRHKYRSTAYFSLKERR